MKLSELNQLMVDSGGVYTWGVLYLLDESLDKAKFKERLIKLDNGDNTDVFQQKVSKVERDITNIQLDAINLGRDESFRDMGSFEDAFLNGHPTAKDCDHVNGLIAKWNKILAHYKVHVQTMDELVNTHKKVPA